MNAPEKRSPAAGRSRRRGMAMDEAAWLVFGLGIGLMVATLLVYSRTELTGVRCEALLAYQDSLADTLEVVNQWPRCAPWFDDADALAQGWGE